MIFSAPQERIFSARAMVRIPPPTRISIFARLERILIQRLFEPVPIAASRSITCRIG